jgi:hypothetical protein
VRHVRTSWLDVDHPTHLISWYSKDVSRCAFQFVSILLFASLTWYVTTDGAFHEVLNVSASSVATDLTRKSLKRCH